MRAFAFKVVNKINGELKEQIRFGFTKEAQPKNIEQRSYPYDIFGMGWWGNLGWGEPSSANERVNELRAMRISTVYTCVKIISETMACMMPDVFQRTTDGKRKVAYAHPAHYLIHDAANDDMTSYDFWFTITMHAAAWGAGYAVIVRDEYNDAIRLDILCPWEVTPKTVEGDLYYVHRQSAEEGKQFINTTYKADELLIIKAFTINGKIAISPIRFNSEIMGFAIKQEKYRSRAFGMKPPGYLQTDNLVKEDQIPGIKEHFISQVSGDEVGGVPLLYNGLKYQNISLNPADLQALEMGEATFEQICGMFRLPPTFVQNYRNSTYSTAEQQDLVFMKYTMMPWVTNAEQECNAKLFSSDNKTAKEPFFVKFNMKTFLRADYKTLTEGLRALVSIGIYSINMALEYLDEDVITESWADQHFMQMNMIPLDKMNDFVEKLKSMPKQEGEPNQGEGKEKASIGLEFLIERVLERSKNGVH